MMIVPFVASTTVYALLPTFNDPVFQSQLVKACNKIAIILPEHQSSGYIIYKCTHLVCSCNIIEINGNIISKWIRVHPVLQSICIFFRRQWLQHLVVGQRHGKTTSPDIF